MSRAKQFKRANRMLKKLRTLLGRDVSRKIEGDSGLEGTLHSYYCRRGAYASRSAISAAKSVRSLHAQEVCVEVSVATTISHAKDGQFVSHVKALPGNPYDGHRQS